MMRTLHRNRLRFSMFSDQNPLMLPVKAAAEMVRAWRRPVSPANPLLAMEQASSEWISTCLQSWGAMRDMMTEHMFLTTYGSPLVQALAGLGTDQPLAGHGIEHDLVREAVEARRRAELATRLEVGGLPEAMIRALIYIRVVERSADERGFAMVKALRDEQPVEKRLSLPRLKEAFTEQFLLLQQNPEHAIGALPALLPREATERQWALAALRRVAAASGALSEEGSRRMARVEALFNSAEPARANGEMAHA